TQLAAQIKENETFRVTVEKRFTHMSSKDIIEAAAANIDRKVDLINPNKIVLVEVVGGFTGVSVLKPSDIISIMKEKFES
ncbi:MAG: THUMP domain-containing protein, partial [Candidatus Bathyarchaeota archaeon]|nr:THUMP domain-containing protein [Candidatus Bathyarchaeota archaeon]